LGSYLLFPFNVASTWLLIKFGLNAISREMATMTNALKDKENRITATMKAEVMREKAERGKEVELCAGSARAGDEGLRTPRGGEILSRIGTPILRGTPRLGAAEREDDVERGESSRSGSQVGLISYS
jgi:hypothetical protein